MSSSLTDLYRSGKTPKAWYFATAWLRTHYPAAAARKELARILRTWQSRPDAEEIFDRVKFYCPLNPEKPAELPADAMTLGAPQFGDARTVYRFDLLRWRPYFPADRRLLFQPGDVFENPARPTIIKARRLDGPGAENAIIFPLNTLRHFPHPHDNLPFARKEPLMFFRGKIADKPGRIAMMENYFGAPGFDLADTGHSPELRKFQAPKVSIAAHFRYKYIIVPEGNDVGSALGWVLGSNCVPVITRPRVEHWLMHSRLEPDRHYLQAAPDFSDLHDVLRRAEANPRLTAQIALEGRKYYERFLDSEREKIVALLVLQRYFAATGQC